MKWIAALLLLISMAQTGHAATQVLDVRTPATEQAIEQGRQALYALRLVESDQRFRSLAGRPDGVLASSYHLALSALVRAIVTDRNSDYRAFLSRADSIEADLKRRPDGVWNDYVRAELSLYRAIVFGAMDKQVNAALAARSAYLEFSRLLKAHPDCYEAYAGMGTIHLAIGSLPRGYRRVLSLLGFSGSVEGGLKELEIAAARSRYGRDQAQLTMALTEVLLFGEPERGIQPIRKLVNANSESPLFAYFYGLTLLKARRASEAESQFRRAAATHQTRGVTGIRASEFYIGRMLLMDGRYAGAEREFRRFLARPGGVSFRAAGLVGLGTAVEMQGRRNEAVRIYRQVRSSRDLDADKAAIREANERLARPLVGVDRTLFLGRMSYDAGRYDDAKRYLEPLLASPRISAEQRAEAGYRLGRVHQAQNDEPDALTAYRTAIRESKNPDARWAPWSQFYSGVIYAERRDTTSARAAFRAALAYKGKYDYHQALEQAAKAWLERLD